MLHGCITYRIVDIMKTNLESSQVITMNPTLDALNAYSSALFAGRPALSAVAHASEMFDPLNRNVPHIILQHANEMILRIERLRGARATTLSLPDDDVQIPVPTCSFCGVTDSELTPVSINTFIIPGDCDSIRDCCSICVSIEKSRQFHTFI